MNLLMGYKGENFMSAGWFVSDWVAEMMIEANDGEVPADMEQVEVADELVVWHKQDTPKDKLEDTACL